MSTQATGWLAAGAALSAGVAAGTGVVSSGAAWTIILVVLALACALLWRIGADRGPRARGRRFSARHRNRRGGALRTGGVA